MTVEQKQHFVAFLDILGFSNMVTDDDSSKYLAKLFKCHQAASTIFQDDPNCSITQFSDSIVVARPFDAEGFEWFARRVGEYQRLLLDSRLICRGGIAVNKHFSNGTFTFSAGLIDAYRVESNLARFPRVVVSSDVIDLVMPDRKTLPRYLLKEDDGLVFVNYLDINKRKRPKTLNSALSELVSNLLSRRESSIREKGVWLANYSDYVLNTSHTPNKFSDQN